jgi:hypothetical protein
MPTLILPDPSDAGHIIADFLSGLVAKGITTSMREKVIENCTTPLTQIILAIEAAAAAGPVEEEIIITFIHCLNAQAEAHSRQTHFAELLHKLAAHDRLH